MDITNSKLEKVKDPRRVQAGRKLASISKDAKMRKASERASMTMGSQEDDNVGGDGDGFSFNHLVGLVGAVTGVGALYLAYVQTRNTSVVAPQEKPKEKPQEKPKEKSSSGAMESFD